MDLNERYESGFYSGTLERTYAAPPWAKALGWDGVGCWLLINPDDIKTKMHGLFYEPLLPSPAVLTLGTLSEVRNQTSQLFRLLEEKGLNILGHCPNLTLHCFAATLVRSLAGEFSLVGMFELAGNPYPDTPKLVCQLPGKLIILSGPGMVSLPEGVSVVPPFTVPARITCNSAELLHEEEERMFMAGFRTSEPADAVFLNVGRSQTLRLSSSNRPKASSATSAGAHTILTQKKASRLHSVIKKVSSAFPKPN